MRVAALLAGLLLCISAGPARAAYHALEEIPVESAIYAQAAQLVASYGTGGAFLASQPWDRADLGRFLDALRTANAAAASDPLFRRLQRELEPDSTATGGWEPLVQGEDDRASLEMSPYVRADYAEDRARRDGVGIKRDFRLGVQGSYAPDASLLLAADIFSGTTAAGPHGNPADSKHFGLIEGVQINSYFDRGYATWRGRLGRLHVGHTWLRWGSGLWGSMALSDGARAFDVAQARMPLLRRAQLEWFVAVLDPAAQTYLAGHKLDVTPSEHVSFSFGELARFDGSSNMPLYLLPVIPYSHIEKRILKSSDIPSDSLNGRAKNNVMWELDAAWQFHPGMRVHGEVAIDDISFSSEQRPKALGWNLGAILRRARPADAITLQMEYARVYQYTYSVFHHHDFEFGGFPTGFALGPDVERFNARLEWRRGTDWSLGAEGVVTNKGEGRLGEFYVPGSGAVDNLPLSGVVDADARGAVTFDYAPAPGLSAGVTAGYARVTALAHVAGHDASGAYGATRFTLRW